MVKSSRSPAEKPSAIKFPSNAILPKEFMAQISIGHRRYFVTGNGHNIHVGFFARKSCDFGDLVRPCRFTEVTVFPLVPVTVRGVIAMSHEKFLVAFGHTFLAFIGLDQIRCGGELCASRVVSTKRIIVGGRRIGPNKMQLFYEDGGIEIVEVKHNKTIYLTKTGKKLDLQGGDNKVACWVQHENYQSPVLLGTTHGQVVSSIGKIFFRGGSGAIRQMVPINERLVMLLFGDRSIGLLDLRYHVIRNESVHKGRFSAIEDEFQKDVIIVGDIDGTLHSFLVDCKEGSLKFLMSSRSEYDDAIVVMHVIEKGSLACATAMGSLFVVSRASFLPLEPLALRGNFGQFRFVRNSADKWYMTILGHLFLWTSKVEYDNVVAGTEGASFYKLKHFHYDDFDLVYAYGRSHVFLDCASASLTGRKKKRRQQVLIMEDPIVSVVASVDHLLVQTPEEVVVYELCENKWTDIFEFDIEMEERVTAFTAIQVTDNRRVFVIASSNGKVRWSKHETDKGAPPSTPLETLDDLHSDYVVAIQPDVKQDSFGAHERNRLHLLTAKSQYLVYRLKTRCECNCKDKGKDRFLLEKYMNYRRLIGRGWDMMWSDGSPLLVGFKDNVMNVYKPGEYMQMSIVTKGPRSNYAVHEVRNTGIAVLYDMGKGMVLSQHMKIGRLMISDLRHSSPITHILVLEEFAGKKKLEVADFITGDARGRVVVMTASGGPSDSKIHPSYEHQLAGAVLAMHNNHGHVIIGTSLGYLYFFKSTDRRLELVHRMRLDHAVTAFAFGPVGPCNCKPDCVTPSTLLSLADGSIQSIGASEDGETSMGILPICFNRRAKWFWPLSCDDCVRMLSLTPEGVLHMDDDPTRPIFSRNSMDAQNRQRYSYINIIDSLDVDVKGDFQVTIAGYHDGTFLLTVFCLQKKKFLYFHVDNIHSHEIIDGVFWMSDDHKHLQIGTLDKTGVYVQRTLLIDKKVKFIGTPQKWYCPVPQPKALAVLKRRNEVFVVGKGLASRFF